MLIESRKLALMLFLNVLHRMIVLLRSLSVSSLFRNSSCPLLLLSTFRYIRVGIQTLLQAYLNLLASCLQRPLSKHIFLCDDRVILSKNLSPIQVIVTEAVVKHAWVHRWH